MYELAVLVSDLHISAAVTPLPINALGVRMQSAQQDRYHVLIPLRLKVIPPNLHAPRLRFHDILVLRTGRITSLTPIQHPRVMVMSRLMTA